MVPRGTKYLFLFFLVVFVKKQGLSQDDIDSTMDQTHKVISYGDKGFRFADHSGNYLLNLEFRGQFRLSWPSDTDPIELKDFQKEQLYLGIKRARLKVGGHAYKPWMKYYTEYELFSSNLLDFRLMFEKVPWLKIKVGQWKVQYNRERIISSGKQQTAERSILTRAFTVDRQQGISAYGVLAGKGVMNFNYWLSVFMGTGRGSMWNDDGKMMYMSRIQWNPTGKSMKFTGSDLEYNEKFIMLFALAGVTNQSPYTRFSQSGGGQLSGFEEGEAGQYRVNQLMEETAGKYRGFSWQQELHYKQIIDHINNTETEMAGNLIQAGYFFGQLWESFPKELEIFARHAFYFPDLKIKEIFNDEYTLGVNWFFSGHRFKLTAEVSHLSAGISSEEIWDGWRYRTQLDVSF